MKRIITNIVAILLLTMPSMAQENKRPRFNPQEFRAKLETYITQKAELTQDEADKVFPIFEEMKKKQHDAMKAEQELRRKGNGEFDSDKDYQAALEKITEQKVKSAKIEAEYYKKMCKSISARKVFLIKRADDEFHREMLQRFNTHKPKRKK